MKLLLRPVRFPSLFGKKKKEREKEAISPNIVTSEITSMTKCVSI